MSDAAAIPHQARVHATLSSIGFLVLLPVGILIPRYARTFTKKWFFGHVVFQFLFAGPVIMAGFAMGYKAVTTTINTGGLPSHFTDQHMKVGLTLFILYFVQITVGLVAHLVKPPSHPFLLHRSPQRIFHIALGLTMIGLSFFQVRLGYMTEWVLYIGSVVPSSVNKGWMAMVVVIPVLYVLGFALFPRQLSQEAAMREEHRNGYASNDALRQKVVSS